MAGFGKSFDEAFKPANAQAIAGTYDLIKEKIKEDAAKAEEAANVAANITAATNLADKVSAVSGDPSISNIIHSALYTATPDGKVTPIKQTKESSAAFLAMAQKGMETTNKLNELQNRIAASSGLQPTQPNQMPDWQNQMGKFQAESNMVNEMKSINPGADLTTAAPQPALIGGKPYSPIPGFETPAQTKAKGITQDATDIAEAIKNGTQPPTLTGLGRTGLAGEVRAKLARDGVDYSKLSRDWVSTTALAKNLNSTQQLRMNQALNSVQTSIDPLRELSKEVERVGFVPANKMIIGAKLNGISLDTKGLNPDQVKVATKYVTQINLMRDELAQGFMGGGVPTETAFKLTDGILNPAYSKGQLSSALDQLEVNLNIRRNAISSTPALMVGGGNNQQSTSSIAVGTKATNPKTKQTLTWDGQKWA